MAYVRKRTTKAGSVSTTLVESYRDETGRPRQRVLANLHGEPDTLRALAVCLLEQQLIPYARVRDLCADVVGAPVSLGMLVQCVDHWAG